MSELVVPAIETERLLLRQATPQDLDEFGRRIFGDPDVIRFMPKRDMTPRERAERAYDRFSEGWQKQGCGGWLTDKANGELIGECNFDTQEVSGFELGYTLAKAYWGQGMATEAARAAARFGFENAKLERIVAVVVPENTASWNVLERIGFVSEKETHAYGFELVYYALNRDKFQPDDSFYRVYAPNRGQ